MTGRGPSSLHFPPHGKDGLPHIGVGHLIHVHCLDDLSDAKRPNGIGQPVQRVYAANADEQLVPCEETGHIAFERSLGQKSTFPRTVTGHMDPGIAACAVREPTAGEPAVLPVWSVRFIQPYFQPLYEPILIPNRNKKPAGTGERPLAVIGAKAGESAQLMPAGAEQVGYQRGSFLSAELVDAVEGFAAAVGSAAVFGGGHNGLSAESFDGADDPFVVARHVTVGEKGVRFFVDVPDHRFAREVGQRFAWESGRCVPCRYQCQEFHVFRFFNGRRAADAESFTGLNALQI